MDKTLECDKWLMKLKSTEKIRRLRTVKRRRLGPAGLNHIGTTRLRGDSMRFLLQESEE
jgi:hypothetical protein